MRSIPAALSWELFSNAGNGLFPSAFFDGKRPGDVISGACCGRDGRPSIPKIPSMIPIHATMMFVNATNIRLPPCVAAMGESFFSKRTYPAPDFRRRGVAVVAGDGRHVLLECLLSTAVINALFKVELASLGARPFSCPSPWRHSRLYFWLTEKSPLVSFHSWHPGGRLAAGSGSIRGMAWYSFRRAAKRTCGGGRSLRPDVPDYAGDGGRLVLRGGCRREARGRCGEYSEHSRSFTPAGPAARKAARSGPGDRAASACAQAQFWLEWRQKGWALPTIVIMGLTSGFIAWLLCNRNPRDLFDGAIAAGAMLPVGGLIVGLIFGNASTNLGGTLEMGPFLAARPLTSPDMSRITLRAAGVSVIVAWLIWVAAYLRAVCDSSLPSRCPPIAVSPGKWAGGISRSRCWEHGFWLACMTNIGRLAGRICSESCFCGVPAVDRWGDCDFAFLP